MSASLRISTEEADDDGGDDDENCLRVEKLHSARKDVRAAEANGRPRCDSSRCRIHSVRALFESLASVMVTIGLIIWLREMVLAQRRENRAMEAAIVLFNDQ